jgi:glutathione S-transferase
MATPYRVFGAELSPYSVKVRSYFRYKGIPHQWIIRDMSNMAEFQKYAKLPLIPLVITPEDEGIQDSTPILEKLEALFPEPSIHPDATAWRRPFSAGPGRTPSRTWPRRSRSG